jgi:hypothetical protein
MSRQSAATSALASRGASAEMQRRGAPTQRGAAKDDKESLFDRDEDKDKEKEKDEDTLDNANTAPDDDSKDDSSSKDDDRKDEDDDEDGGKPVKTKS